MNQDQFYQTSFSIRPAEGFDCKQLFQKVKLLVWKWVEEKEHRKNPRQNLGITFDQFGEKIPEFIFPSRSKIMTGTCLMNNEVAWAMDYSEPDEK